MGSATGPATRAPGWVAGGRPLLSSVPPRRLAKKAAPVQPCQCDRLHHLLQGLAALAIRGLSSSGHSPSGHTTSGVQIAAAKERPGTLPAEAALLASRPPPKSLPGQKQEGSKELFGLLLRCATADRRKPQPEACPPAGRLLVHQAGWRPASRAIPSRRLSQRPRRHTRSGVSNSAIKEGSAVGFPLSHPSTSARTTLSHQSTHAR